jgi:hypothetical protein
VAGDERSRDAVEHFEGRGGRGERVEVIGGKEGVEKQRDGGQRWGQQLLLQQCCCCCCCCCCCLLPAVTRVVQTASYYNHLLVLN